MIELEHVDDVLNIATEEVETENYETGQGRSPLVAAEVLEKKSGNPVGCLKSDFHN